MPDLMSTADFAYNMQVNGCMLFEEVVPASLCERMKEDIRRKYEANRPAQVAAGLGKAAEWCAHHICGGQDGIHDFLAADTLDPYLRAYFDDKPYILNSISAPINAPQRIGGSYEHGHKWHRDVRTYVGQGNRQLAVVLVMLDDFTIENGATEVLPGTHRCKDFPPERFIAENRKVVCGKRGSVIFYDGDIWHRAGENTTDQFRAGMTCTFTRPYFKQQLDYPRFLDPVYAATLSPAMRQLFGFDARTPASIEEWYQPAESRFYKSSQE